jgi:hypothetical protein
MTSPPTDVLHRVLERADAAPSVHGTKPWWWQTTETGVELYVRAERQLATTDPEGRDLTISCGAALYSLEVAAAAEGWRAGIRRLPEPGLRSLLARVRFEPHEATADVRTHAERLGARRIDRRAGPSEPLPESDVKATASLAGERGVFAVVLDPRETRQVLGLLAESARTQQADRDYRRELKFWGQQRRPIDPADIDATWVILTTTSDDRLSWLRTGEALQAIWLWATAHCLTLVPHSQAIELDSTRARLQEELLQDTTCPQLLLRLGWAPVDVAPADTRTSAHTA